MFIGLLSASTTARLGESLGSNSKGHIKCVSLNNRPCQACQACPCHLLI